MRQFIPDAPLRQATPQHHREQKPHHAQAGKVLQATLLLLPLRTVLHTREQQLARIHLLYHAQAYPLAHLVSLLAVAYSIHIGMFLSALLHGLTLSVVCQKGYPFVCSGSPFLLFEMYWGQGRIVNMGSLAGKVAFTLWGPYAASKFAVEALTDALRMELLPWHLMVSLVEPFVIATPLWKKIAPRLSENSTQDAQRLYGPLLSYVDDSMPRTGQSGLPADNVAKAVVHALTAKTPKTRYVVTKPGLSLMIRLLRLLPDRIRDRLLRQSLPKYP